MHVCLRLFNLSPLFVFVSACARAECRCFVSSLMDISKFSVNPSFPRFGLCYRANCYRPNYLQFAIRSQFTNAVDWYKCPTQCVHALRSRRVPAWRRALPFHCPHGCPPVAQRRQAVHSWICRRFPLPRR